MGLAVLGIDGFFTEYLPKVHFLLLDTKVRQEQFYNHFLLHAALTLFLLSLPYRKAAKLALCSLGLALLIEFVGDGHAAECISSSVFGKDMRTDLLARVTGSLFPYLILFWRKPAASRKHRRPIEPGA